MVLSFRTVAFVIATLCPCVYLLAQFGGGNNDGFAFATYIAPPSPTSQVTFGGGNGDGFSFARYVPVTPPSILATFGGGRSDGFAMAFSGSDVTLPITLRSFSGSCGNQKVYLEWTTETEIDNHLFMILQSYDGMEWNEFRTMSGSGTTSSPHTYSLSEDIHARSLDIHESATLYFKLYSKDYDGTVHHGKVISVICQPGLSIHLYPNPTAGMIHISGLIPGDMTYSVFNYSGKLVQNGRQEGVGPAEEISLESFPYGAYLIMIENGSLQKSFLVIKE